MSEKNVLLSKLEQEMLINPEGLSTRQKRNLNYRLKTKSNQIDQVLQEINLLIKNVSDESIKESISNKTISSLIEILEKILLVLDPWPIGVDEKGEGVLAFRIYGHTKSSINSGKCTIQSKYCTAAQEEIELDYLLTNHLNKIRYYVDPCIPDPVCRNSDVIFKRDDKAFETKMKLGESYIRGAASYHDETGIDEDGWVLREPVKIDKDQLHWMRWKPKGLKECMKQPPLLKEIRIPGKWNTEASISLASSTPEKIEKFTEIIQKQNEKPKLTEKELLEVNERIKKIPRSEDSS
jgi:hypothetical protein